MIRFLISAVIFFLSALLGLFVANLVLDDMSIDGVNGYLWVAVIFAVLQAVLAPFIFKVVAKNAGAFTGGIGIISTLVALIITSVLSSSLHITGLVTWVLAAIIVWLVTALATVLLPLVLVKKAVDQNRA
jgi:hypothetical protein